MQREEKEFVEHFVYKAEILEWVGERGLRPQFKIPMQ